jgi:hypothetical protein
MKALIYLTTAALLFWVFLPKFDYSGKNILSAAMDCCEENHAAPSVGHFTADACAPTQEDGEGPCPCTTSGACVCAVPSGHSAARPAFFLVKGLSSARRAYFDIFAVFLSEPYKHDPLRPPIA